MDRACKTVTLTSWEFVAAVEVGMNRFAMSEARHLNNASTYERGYLERLQQEVIGACGELAFCKAKGLYWPPSVDTFHHVPDVGVNIEVRATARDDGCLIVRDNDDPARYYVLVTGEPPNLTIRGSIRGAAARRTEFERNPNGHRQAWFVPQSALVKPLVGAPPEE